MKLFYNNSNFCVFFLMTSFAVMCKQSMNEDENLHSVSDAVDVLLFVGFIGFAGLRTFAQRAEKRNSLMSNENETLDISASSCWTGEAYISMWLGDENKSRKYVEVATLEDLYKLENGVYYMALECFETHFWVWIIKNEEIWYAGSYGGIKSLSIFKRNKKEYLEKFIKAMKGSVHDYNYVFQIEADTNDVDFGALHYSKSNLYV